MQLRRHKDIIAIKTGASRPVALHARNLSVAEISEEAWNELTPTELAQSLPVSISTTTEAALEIAAWDLFDEAEISSDRRSFGVRSLTLNVTQVCNLHCAYCAAGGDGTYGDPVKKISVEQTLPQLKFFLDQVPAGEAFHIAFLGGEPLLYPEAIRGIGEYVRDIAAQRGIHASFKVTTNGTLINEKSLAALKAIRANVVVSIDGPAESHDLQRRTKNGEGSHAMVVKGLRGLLASREELGRIGVHAVFNERHLDVEKAWDFLSEFAVDDIDFTYSVSGTDHEATKTYNENLERVAAKAWAKGGEDELTRIGLFHSVFARLDARRRLENHCGLGKSMLVVDSRNKLWSCPWTIGRKTDLLGANTDLDYDQLAAHQGSLIERNDCGDCWARFICGGGCSFVHGTTASKDALQKKTDYCIRTRFLIALATMYYHLARTPDAESV